VASADKKIVLLVLPSSYLVDIGKAQQCLDAQSVHLAREEELQNIFPDCKVGTSLHIS
jgi:prolyl-tRNA editing enzyme YbaK/EbsC (Cys-tRNA(Pro) deacylase)